jgi:hypothetical protein
VDKTDFNDKSIKKVQFWIIGINDERKHEKYLGLKTGCIENMRRAQDDKTILEIFLRLGTGKETRYYFVKAVR